jgi:hypothetical protein
MLPAIWWKWREPICPGSRIESYEWANLSALRYREDDFWLFRVICSAKFAEPIWAARVTDYEEARYMSLSTKRNPLRPVRDRALNLETKMPTRDTYMQNCPVCGRPLVISAEYNGRNLGCRHCGGRFTAHDPAKPFAVQDSAYAILRRADQLLALSSRKLRFRNAG